MRITAFVFLRCFCSAAAAVAAIAAAAAAAVYKTHSKHTCTQMRQPSGVRVC